jgi:hypothetical protein
VTVGRDPSTVSIGSGTLYIAPIGTTEPVALSAFPLNAPWVDLGYTEAGTVFTENRTVQPVMVDEEFYRLNTIVTDKNATVAFALSQITAKNLQTAYAGGTITTGTGDVQFEPPLAGTETRVMLAWFAKAGDEAYLWRQCFQTGSVATNRKKGTPQALLPVSYELEKPAGKLPFKWFGSLARSGS